MAKMTPEEIDDLLNKPLPAVVATVNPDGTPQLTPIWYDWDGERFVFAIEKVTLKHRNILRDGRVVVCVSTSPVAERYVTLRGKGRLLAGPAKPWRERIWSRYVNLDMAREWIPENEDPEMVAVEVIPERITGLSLPALLTIFEDSEATGGRGERPEAPPER